MFDDLVNINSVVTFFAATAAIVQLIFLFNFILSLIISEISLLLICSPKVFLILSLGNVEVIELLSEK